MYLNNNELSILKRALIHYQFNKDYETIIKNKILAKIEEGRKQWIKK